MCVSPASDPSYPADVRAALLAAGAAELRERGVAALSLRAIAARAGVSRATPTWHFRDRAGLLTAVAIEGFDLLAQRLHAAARAAGPDAAARFTALGRTYLEFGLGEPELFELMFRSDQLDRDAPELAAAQRASFSVLIDTARAVGSTDPAPTTGSVPGPGSALPLLAWATVHGLVVLIRGGALQTLTGISEASDTAALAHQLVDAFTSITSATIE